MDETSGNSHENHDREQNANIMAASNKRTKKQRDSAQQKQAHPYNPVRQSEFQPIVMGVPGPDLVGMVCIKLIERGEAPRAASKPKKILSHFFRIPINLRSAGAKITCCFHKACHQA